MSLLEALLRRLGYIKPESYGLTIDPYGHLVPLTLAPPQPPAGWQSQDGYQLPLPAPPAAFEPPVFIPEAVPTFGPPSPVSLLPPPPPKPAPAPAPQPEAEAEPEEDWEWKLAMARARARDDDTQIIPKAKQVAASRPKPPPTPSPSFPRPATPDTGPVARVSAPPARVARGSAPPPLQRRTPAAAASLPGLPRTPPPLPDITRTDTKVDTRAAPSGARVIPLRSSRAPRPSDRPPEFRRNASRH